MPRINRNYYVPCANGTDKDDLDHREDPVKVFENAINVHKQQVIDDVFVRAKSLYCLTEELRGCIDDKTIERLKADAKDIGMTLCSLTSERLPAAYWYPPTSMDEDRYY